MGTAVTRLSRPLGAIGGAVLILAGLLPVALVAPVFGASTTVINEFSASTAGTDVEYVEILAAPAADLSTYTVLEIEGDAGTSVGTIDEVMALGTTDAEGRILVELPANALENGTISLLLVEAFTGALNGDIDTDNDGTFDTTAWTSIVDGVASVRRDSHELHPCGEADLAGGPREA